MIEKNKSSEQANVLKAVETMAKQPDETFLQQLRQQSAQVFAETVASSCTSTPSPRFETIWRLMMHNRILRLAMVAAILCAVLLGARLLNDTTGKVYASVIQVVQEARTLVYTLITQANDGTGREISTRWHFKDPGFLRTETEGGHVTVIDGVQGQQLSLIPENKSYIDGSFETPAGDADGPFAAVKRLRALPARADEVLPECEIEGCTARGYRVTTGDETTTVWIDVDTQALVLVEHHYGSAPGMNYRMKAIQLDVALDDSLFALVPPEGYTQNMTLDMGTGGSEGMFVDYLRFWATELTKDQTFPPIVVGPQMSTVMVDMAKQGRLHHEKLQKLTGQEMYQALIWVASLPEDTHWRYAGNGISFGDPQTPIFWYRPLRQTHYRVVYADLTIKEVAPEDVPQ